MSGLLFELCITEPTLLLETTAVALLRGPCGLGLTDPSLSILCTTKFVEIIAPADNPHLSFDQNQGEGCKYIFYPHDVNSGCESALVRNFG